MAARTMASMAVWGGGKYDGKGYGKHGKKGGKKDVDKGKNKPNDTEKRFEGICSWCGRRGHREADCVFKKGYDEKATQPEQLRSRGLASSIEPSVSTAASYHTNAVFQEDKNSFVFHIGTENPRKEQ